VTIDVDRDGAVIRLGHIVYVMDWEQASDRLIPKRSGHLGKK
jgi:hypothetical protein